MSYENNDITEYTKHLLLIFYSTEQTKPNATKKQVSHHVPQDTKMQKKRTPTDKVRVLPKR